MTFDLGSLALGWMANYGAPMVGGLLFLGGLGLPLPGTLLVVASGAFIRQSVLDALATPLWGYLGTVAGDASLFAVGMLASQKIEQRFGNTSAWRYAHDLFMRRGGVAIFLTRWLLTAAAFPTTLIAGSSGYRFSRFLLFDMLGELTWIALYGGLGYIFGSQWELVSEFISNMSGFLFGAVVLAAGITIFRKFGKTPVTEG